MSTISYTGITAYVRNTPETTDRFRVLEDALYQLQPFTGVHNEDLTKYQGLMESAMFQELSDNAAMMSPDAYMFPKNTPVEYQSVELSSLEVNDVFMTRLYLPLLSKNDDRIAHMTNDVIRPILLVLFGENLVAIKTKSSDEYSDFADAQEQVLVSANRVAAPAGI